MRFKEFSLPVDKSRKLRVVVCEKNAIHDLTNLLTGKTTRCGKWHITQDKPLSIDGNSVCVVICNQCGKDGQPPVCGVHHSFLVPTDAVPVREFEFNVGETETGAGIKKD